MIRIEKLILKNFMCVKEASLEFPKDAIIVITGNNANGKSTVCDAIAVALDEYRRGDAYAEYIRKGQDTASIHFDAYINDEPIVFDITISKKGTAFQRVIKFRNTSYTNSECTTLLASLDMQYYSHVLFSMQGDNTITSLTPTQRANVLYKLFNYDFGDKLEKVTAKIDEVKSKISYNENQLEFLRSQDFNLATEEPLPFSANELVLKEAALETLLQQRESMSAIASANNKIHMKIIPINKEIATLRESQSTASIATHGAKNLVEQLQRDIESSTALSLSATAEVEKLATSLLAKKATYAGLAESYKAVTSRISETKEAIIHAEYAVKDFGRKTALAAEGKCDKCGSSTEALVTKAAIEENSANLSLIESLKQKQAAHSKELQELSPLVEEAKKEATRIEVTLERHQKDILSAKDRLNNATTKLPSVKSQLAVAESRHNEIVMSLAAKEKEANTLSAGLASYSESELKEINHQISLINEEMKKFSSILHRNEVIRDNNLKIEQARLSNLALQETTQKAIRDYAAILTVYNEVKGLLEKSFPNYLVVKTCAKLQSEINSFIQTVFPNMRVKLYQNKKGVEFYYLPDVTEITESDDKANWISVHMASGMEKQALSTAWRVALAKAYNLSILLLDEVDSSASDESSDALFRALVQNTMFSQLLIITHKKDVRDAVTNMASNSCVYLAKKGEFRRIS